MTKYFPVRVCIFVSLMLLGFSLHARVYSPRVISEHNADAYSMRTFADDPRFSNLQRRQQAQEMFTYLTDYDTGLYPMGSGAFEGTESLYEYSLVRDPVKIINVYGIGYCDVFGPIMAGVWEDSGLGVARVVDLPLIDHVASEIYYDGMWHYLDVDLRAAFVGDDGVLASLQESRSNPELWSRPNEPRFFPLDNIADMQQSFVDSDVINRYGVHQSGHTMDFILRQGESFTRWWQPQGGRWLHSKNFDAEPFVSELIETAPRGPKSKHASFTRHTYGNGQFVYDPDLTIQSTDFSDGVYDSQNIVTSENGLTLSNTGSGYAVFEVRTPYVIVPVVGNTSTEADDRDASVVNINASGATYSISLDNGITWEPVQIDGSGIDLTASVAGEYGYLFRVQLSGEPGQAVLRSLSIITWVQLAPASLPSLRTGSNRMDYRSGDHYGLNTRVMEISPDTADRSDFFKYLVATPTDYFPESLTSRIQSPFAVAVEAPPNSRIAWFSAGGSFESYQLDSAPFTGFSMGYSTDLPFGYTDFYSTNMPADMEHWHTNAQEEVVLSEPSEAVYVSYEAEPAVNTVKVYAHVIDNNVRQNNPVTITHRWYENNELQSYQTTSENGVYFVDVAGDPVNVSIELSVGSDYSDAPVSQEPSEPVVPVDSGSENTAPSLTVGAGVMNAAGLWQLFLLLMSGKGIFPVLVRSRIYRVASLTLR